MTDFNAFNNIHSEKNWTRITALSGWLFFWVYLEYVFINDTFSNGASAFSIAIFACFLLFWNYVAIGNLIVILWLLAGQERIKIEGDTLLVEKKLVGFVSVKKFEIKKIRAITINKRVLEFGNNFNFIPFQNGMIFFDYNDKREKFCVSYNRKLAREIIVFLRSKTPFTDINFR